jgi:uncharacterized membrane protein YhiD involved in acid resistance
MVGDFIYRLFADNYTLERLMPAITNLILASLCGIGIFIVFFITYKKISVSRSFSCTLILLSPVACVVALIISNNIVVAVGMVGALSIIRFRHSMKESKNLVFVFWAVTAGLACGLGLKRIAVVSCAIIAVLVVVTHFLIERRRYGTLAVKTSGSIDEIENIFKEHTVQYKINYQSIDRQSTGKQNTDHQDTDHQSIKEKSDILYEIKHKGGYRRINQSVICKRIMLLEGVSSVKYIEA